MDRDLKYAAVRTDWIPACAGIVGTRAQLEAFAHAILRALETSTTAADWHGIRVSLPHSDHSLTDTMAGVVLDGVVVVASEVDRRALVNAIRINCGDSAIDWDGRDGQSL